MRVLVVLLLLQFISPCLFSDVTLGAATSDQKPTLTPLHSSIVIPIFLKEQEERDQEEVPDKTVDFILLIDFSNHSITHTACQSLIYKGHSNQDKFGYSPPLFKLNCTFLI